MHFVDKKQPSALYVFLFVLGVAILRGWDSSDFWWQLLSYEHVWFCLDKYEEGKENDIFYIEVLFQQPTNYETLINAFLSSTV